ncbi:MAG TPA: glycoside hydrolase family 28 protein [Pilimelia sp.]|nr:glycoside hydrolase family 28 protein [Pilimelia sp.]
MTRQPSRRDILKLSALLVGGATVAPFIGTGPAVSAGPAAADSGCGPWAEVPRILRRIRPPVFPRRSFDITRFGAVGDGTTDCTEAFRRAIAVCHRAGGGRVLVPPGAFLTGAIHLRSNVNLHLADGATIRFSPDPASYLPVVFTRWEGTECYNYSPFIYAYGQRNVAVTGHGTLDGQARLGPWESWYASGGPQRIDQAELRRMGNEGVPVAERQFGAGHFLRPKMVQFYRCENVLVSDVTIVDPPMWTVHPVLSRNVTVRRITVDSTLFNTDGCNPECCTDVHITGCRFNTNDDCVAVKAGRDEDGHRVGVPSTNIVVERCKFAGRWGGITVGSEMSGGVSNVFARDCEINPADFPGRFPIKYPLYIKTNKLRGGYIDGVHLRNFTGGRVEREALYVILNYNNQVGTRPVLVQNITVDRMVLDGARRAVWLTGLETDHIRSVHVMNSDFTAVTNPAVMATFVDDLTFTNVTVNGAPIEAVLAATG